MTTAAQPTTDRVTVFPTCLGDLTMPDVVARTFAALRACGYQPRLAEDVTCCGQPAYNSGFDAQARRVARATLKGLSRTDGPIVVPAGSCSAMMILHWRELFRGTRHERDAVRVSQRVRELTTVLAERADRLAALGLRWDGTVAYHDSCHMLRELRIADAPRAVLGAVEGVTVVSTGVAPRCCGFGGTFSMRYPEVSTAMADATLDDATAASAHAVVSADPGCLMHLGARAGRRGDAPRVMHVATFLHEAGLR
ncbi:MAG: (Fe-S)-binding protein [Thermoleophilia bacterium]|nr:(Fe-S)-binding protein [Thermoleophilia bacterium]